MLLEIITIIDFSNNIDSKFRLYMSLALTVTKLGENAPIVTLPPDPNPSPRGPDRKTAGRNIMIL